MRFAPILFALLVSPVCRGSNIGALLWEAGLDRAAYATANSGQRLLFPGVPVGGKAPKDAMLVGIIDSGVLLTHPQLAGYVSAARDFTGEGDDDVLGHGTAVALTALFSLGSTSPKAAIVSAKVVGRDGKIQKNKVIQAVQWMAARGVKIVNLSLGFPGSRTEHRDLCDALARRSGILFVAAAGNEGPDTEMFPAACKASNVMSVGANNEQGQLAAYSGRGSIRGPGQFVFLKEWAFYYQDAQELAKSGRLVEARQLYERSFQAELNAESAFQLGLLDLAERLIDPSIAQFRLAIKIDPALAQAHEMLGAALFIRGEYQAAVKALRTAIDLYPEHIQTVPSRARAHFNLGQALLGLGLKGEARRAFEEAKRLLPAYPRIDEILQSIGP